MTGMFAPYPDRSLMDRVDDFLFDKRRAPTTEEVYALADFGQPGGIERLCAAVSALTHPRRRS